MGLDFGTGDFRELALDSLILCFNMVTLGSSSVMTRLIRDDGASVERISCERL